MSRGQQCFAGTNCNYERSAGQNPQASQQRQCPIAYLLLSFSRLVIRSCLVPILIVSPQLAWLIHGDANFLNWNGLVMVEYSRSVRRFRAQSSTYDRHCIGNWQLSITGHTLIRSMRCLQQQRYPFGWIIDCRQLTFHSSCEYILTSSNGV